MSDDSISHMTNIRHKLHHVRSLLNLFALERIHNHERKPKNPWEKILTYMGIVSVASLQKSALPGDVLMGKMLFNSDEHFLMTSARRLQEMYNNGVCYGIISITSDDQILLDKLTPHYFQHLYNKIMRLENSESWDVTPLQHE